MLGKSSSLFALLFFSSFATANVTLKGIFLGAAEQSTGVPLIVMKVQNNTLVAQTLKSQKEIALRLRREDSIEISCPIEDIVKSSTADKEYMDYMANNCMFISANSINLQS